MRRLEGKVTLVPGSGRALGRAAALRFAAEGALVVGGDSDHALALETQRLIGRAGGIALNPVELDAADPDSVRVWAEEAVAAFGGIDVLFAHAGAVPCGHIEEQSFADYTAAVRAQLDPVWLCAKAAWPHLTLGAGCIVTVGSAAAVAGSPDRGLGAHAAAAGGIVALSRQLAAEGAPGGIRVNCISPGGIDPDGTDPAATAGAAERAPLGRAGQPDDVLNAAVFLASGEASYITGAHLVVDGGWSAVRPG
ncbi:SDR family NAD(P)-dependent oxidoreductase [Streptomyces longisporoflavus]|uniref:SDR family NAD(P)-dependent oxidoreductase n=1 Tax=Streptomyces longisporoflavus TaxID=28044 RepID=A0ABW7QJ80_9ACTN